MGAKRKMRDGIPMWKTIRHSGLLEMRVIRVGERRTSLRLESEMWHALEQLAAREKITMAELCAHVESTRLPEGSFTACLRAFLISYYYRALTRQAG